MTRANRYGLVEEGNKIIVGKSVLLAKRYGHCDGSMPHYFDKGYMRYRDGIRLYKFIEVEKLVNFYDVETRKMVSEGVRFSNNQNLDETGYSQYIMAKMLKGYIKEGLIAQQHFFLLATDFSYKNDIYKRILEDYRLELLEKGIIEVNGEDYEIQNLSSDYVW